MKTTSGNSCGTVSGCGGSGSGGGGAGGSTAAGVKRDAQLRQKLRERGKDMQDESAMIQVCCFSGAGELRHEVRRLESQIQYTMSQLTRQVKNRIQCFKNVLY